MRGHCSICLYSWHAPPLRCPDVSQAGTSSLHLSLQTNSPIMTDNRQKHNLIYHQSKSLECETSPWRGREGWGRSTVCQTTLTRYTVWWLGLVTRCTQASLALSAAGTWMLALSSWVSATHRKLDQGRESWFHVPTPMPSCVPLTGNEARRWRTYFSNRGGKQIHYLLMGNSHNTLVVYFYDAMPHSHTTSFCNAPT